MRGLSPPILRMGNAFLKVLEPFLTSASQNFSTLCHFCHIFTNICPGCIGWVLLVCLRLHGGVQSGYRWRLQPR